MKLVFLDVDGVLVNRASYSLPGSGSTSRSIAHPDCVKALNMIITETGAFIVVSSVWRYCGTFGMREHLNRWGVTQGRIIGCTPFLQDRIRGEEIQSWLDHFTSVTVESFVILDDDRDMKHLTHRLVKTDGIVGLTEADADKAIALLSEESSV